MHLDDDSMELNSMLFTKIEPLKKKKHLSCFALELSLKVPQIMAIAAQFCQNWGHNEKSR
jgi:hypothetical protein